MKTQVLVSRAALVGFASLVASAGIASCSSSTEETGQGGGGSSPASSSTASSGGAGGMPDAGGENPLTIPCDQLCGYLGAIQCTSWPKCSTDCSNGFDVPSCLNEVKALIECWVMNKSEFTCTKMQILPPPACQSLESAFNECRDGSGPDPDAGSPIECAFDGAKNSTETSCFAKTTCSDNVTEVKTACALPDGMQVWSCSCYKGESLLGTCTESKSPCSNASGCCSGFFSTGS